MFLLMAQFFYFTAICKSILFLVFYSILIWNLQKRISMAKRKAILTNLLPGDKRVVVGEKKMESESNLRQRAEELLENKLPVPVSIKVKRSKGASYFTEAEAQRIIYELEVHQIELELQNKELLQAKEQIENLADKYTQLYDFSPAGYFTLTKGGEIVDLNLYGSQMLGKDRIRLKNSQFGFFVAEESKGEFSHFIDSVFLSGSNASCDIMLSSENGNIPIELSLTGIISEDNGQCLVAATDISERKRAEKVIKEKNLELQRINAEKDRFFSIIAHDLRGPFNGFLGLTELMVNGLSEMPLEELHEIVVMMRNGATNLNLLLGNLLEWSQMERGMYAFTPKFFKIRPSLDNSLVFVRESASEKEITLDCQIADDLVIYGDVVMVDSLFRNLVSNAVKFTHSGGRITIFAVPFSDTYMGFSIKDTGIGMDKYLIDNLFRLDVNVGRKGTEGELTTGLGLNICKEIITRHKGRIWVESETAKGSIFHFTLPLLPLE